MKYITKILFSISLLLLISCSEAVDYLKDFTNGEEIRYAGKMNDFTYRAGKGRLQLQYKLGPDPNLLESKIYWDLRRDSIVVDLKNADRDEEGNILVMLENMGEGIHSFEAYNYDKFGNKSVQEYLTGKSYGQRFESSIYNRDLDTLKGVKGFYLEKIDTSSGVENNVHLIFLDSLQTSKEVLIEYEDIEGKERRKYLANDLDTILLEGLQENTEMILTTYHVPELTAIDVFKSKPVKIIVPSYNEMSDPRETIIPIPKPYASKHIDGFDTNNNGDWYCLWDDKWPTGWPENPAWYEEVNYANFYTDNSKSTGPTWFTLDLNGYAKLESFTYYFYYPPGQSNAPRVLELWALDSDEVPTKDNEWENWVLVGSFDISNASQSELERYYKEGLTINFNFDEVPAARYYRPYCLKNYRYDDSKNSDEQSHSAFEMSVSELEFTSYGGLFVDRENLLDLSK